MRHSYIVLAALLLLASGCRHALLPELPASHGQLSRVMERYLDDDQGPDSLIEAVRAPTYAGKTPPRAVEPAQAPAVMAEALRRLEGSPTEAQVRQSLDDLAGACRSPLPAACDALRERWEDPKQISFQHVALPHEARDLKAATLVIIECQLTERARLRDCRVVESAPYGITAAMMDSVSRSVFWPAKFAGHPLEVSYTFLFNIPLNPEPLTPTQELGWARARTQRFPASPSAWAHLARALAKFTPDDPTYPEVLRRLHALVPDEWWTANELAWLHARDGRYAEAEPLALTAWREQPRNPYVLETLAVVKAGLGRCPEAVADQRQAMEALPEKWPAPERERFQRTLDTYRQQCPDMAPH
ncbi:energy transducer TonB [Pyxidicoccus caerfyrddinensis]|uniref:energy transducer TonB n=1 Tax=Pyxidicoccus caerfyrddinensis TaxID=2709663 RepID=UPI0013DB3751|nr:energy transducer TonB [Pyxidicoccus caerfyrddinensis]